MLGGRYIEISWTCGSLEEARRVAHELIEKRLVACAQVIPTIESIFTWKGKIDTAHETKVIFKTRDVHFDAVKKAILQQAKYEVPEILKLPILDGNKAYFDWIDETTKN